ncbi:MAG TPA: hypothetical protein VH309_09815 [Elusimicrobiota bacterium]|jgi:hypothetical protein|nr:hypothetical protein [Elusimicrobiota bacterium]
MKTTRFWILLLAASLGASAALAATITVLVERTAVRKRPQFFAPAVATAKLGESFDAEGPSNGWYKVEAGYIHQSAVSAKKVTLSDDSTVAGGGGATADEVTLAGKGFNSQVEQSYGAQNASADFAAVDEMERRSVPESSVLLFLRKGGLLPREDAR